MALGRILGSLGPLSGALGCSWAPLGCLLGASWASLGRSWPSLGRLLGLLKASWVIWASFSKVSGRVWEGLGGDPDLKITALSYFR